MILVMVLSDYMGFLPGEIAESIESFRKQVS